MVKLTKIKDNFIEVEIGNLDIWFSYQTMIAYRFNREPTIITKEKFSQTTSRHKNMIKETYLEYIELEKEEFEEAVNFAFGDIINKSN